VATTTEALHTPRELRPTLHSNPTHGLPRGLGNKAVVGREVDGAVEVDESEELVRGGLDERDERVEGGDELGVDDALLGVHVRGPSGADAKGAAEERNY